MILRELNALKKGKKIKFYAFFILPLSKFLKFLPYTHTSMVVILKSCLDFRLPSRTRCRFPKNKIPKFITHLITLKCCHEAHKNNIVSFRTKNLLHEVSCV